METKFQTSFIPKKPLLAEETVHTHHSTSILMVVGVLLFVASIALAASTFVIKSVLQKTQDQLALDLNNNEKRFNLPLIEELKKANLKIDLASQLLNNHVAVSEAFAIIAGLTAERVNFKSFAFAESQSTSLASTPAPAPSVAPAEGQTVPESPLPTVQPSKLYNIQMKGVTDTFNSVAWQSDVLGSSQKYGTNKVIKNPVLSNLTVDTNGNIDFDFTTDLSLSDISYQKAVSESTAGTPAPVQTGQ